MTNLTPIAGGAPPAIAQNRRSNMNAAAQHGVQASFGVIGYRGRNWRIKYRGEELLLKNEQGAPYPNLDIVVVGVSPNISKQWYEKNFTEGSDEAPDCFSVDGVVPDPSSPKRQSPTCAVCPLNAWGSRVSDQGKKGKACQDSRRIAIVPLGDIDNETYGGPMMLRLPPMSLNNFANYAALLERRGASLEVVGTRLGFDYDVAYPRITFDVVGWLSNEQAVKVIGPDGNSGICADPQVTRMLQEAVVEVTHDPASAVPPNGAVPDPLAGGPPQVVTQRVDPPAPPQPVQQAVPPAPAVTGFAPAGFANGGTAHVPQQAPPAPVATAPASFAPPPARQQRAPAQTTVQALPTTVQGAPPDMMQAIDALLDMPA